MEDIQSIAKFLEDSVRELKENDGSTTFYRQFDSRLALYVGYSGGFDDNDVFVIHSRSEPEYAICTKIAEWNPASIDYEWMYMPWEVDTQEVYDCETSISPNEDYSDLAKRIVETYEEICEWLDQGKLTI